MRNATIEKVISEVKHDPLFKVAFTHTSYANEHKLNYSYERLEFLGDAILNSLVTRFIYEIFPNMDEGEMSSLRSKAVCQETLSNLSIKFNLSEYLLLGNGEEQSGGRKKTGILADIFESFVAMLFLLNGEKNIILILKKSLFLNIKQNKFKNVDDYKTVLQEAVQASQDHCYINYETLKEWKENNQNFFIIQVVINGIVSGEGQGNNKKKAEQDAAKKALLRFKKLKK